MPSKSNAVPNVSPLQELRTWIKTPWGQSLGLHLAITLGAVGVAWLSVQAEKAFDTIPMDVIDSPKPALSPLRSLPEARSKPQETPSRRKVFGLTRQAVTDSESPVESKAGNTVATEVDQKKLRPEDEEPLPIPADEYLVSRMPELLKEVRVYPAEAKKKGIQGTVYLDLLIDAQGRVRAAEIIQGVSPELDQAAREAALQFLFKPASMEQKNVAVKIRYAYRFILEK